jgi:hypothetical protein
MMARRMETPSGTPPRPSTYRTIGMAMLGSSIALGACAALSAAGILPMADQARQWAAIGLSVAAGLDAILAIYFLRMSSSS